MTTITADQVKELRERTGVGLADCKNALIETNGDMDGAIEVLRKKGIAKAAKRADNDTHEGRIMINVEGSNASVVVVACETDFVSRNDVFGEMMEKFMQIVRSTPDVESKRDQIEAIRSEYVLRLGENLRILALEHITGEIIEAYVHSNNKVAALIVARAGTDRDKLRQVAMHITAMNPECLRPDDVSTELIARERDIALALMHEDPKNANKPADILEKIIEGKMKKFREENALLAQPFVVNPDQTVGAFIGADSIVSFKRLSI